MSLHLSQKPLAFAHASWKFACTQNVRLKGYLHANLNLAKRLHGHLDPLSVGENIRRRASWFLEHLTLRKAFNITLALIEFALKREKMLAWPAVLKIDISPLCNLKCTVCVHAAPHGNPDLEQQFFDPSHKMSVDEFRRIIEEVRGKTSALSLYYFGDPLVHPDLDEMCGIARRAGLNVHISTNFSFRFSDERIKRLVTSGLTHLTVCVDGIHQDTYERTRVGGHIDRVLSNLRRSCQMRRELKQSYPRIEVQFIKYQHNVHELDEAEALFADMGVDRVTHFWGWLDNYTDHNSGKYAVHDPQENQWFPQCHWPHFSMLVKHNGDVVPCSNYRMGEQTVQPEGSRVLGNVFRKSVREVWNSAAYRAARRLVSNPQYIKSEPELENHFCFGCPAIFSTDRDKHTRCGSQYRFEEIYTLDAKHIPQRIDRPLNTAHDKSAAVVNIPSPELEIPDSQAPAEPNSIPLDRSLITNDGSTAH